MNHFYRGLTLRCTHPVNTFLSFGSAAEQYDSMLAQMFSDKLFDDLLKRFFLAGRFRFQAGNGLRLQQEAETDPV